jgi:hypothetical protein
MSWPPGRTWRDAAIKRNNLPTFERDLPDEEVLECVCSVLLGGVLEDGGGSGCLTAMTDQGESKEG